MVDILISIRHASQENEIDLEVSSDQPIRECVDFIALRERWASPGLLSSLAYSVETRSSRHLPLDQTFQQANIWDGAELIFHPPGSPAAADPPSRPEEPRQKKPENNSYKMIQLD